MSPNQQVWEQIRVNLERKHGIPTSAGTGGQGSKTAAVSTAIESSESEADDALALQSGPARKRPGPKFIQYGSRRPVGRRPKISAVSERRESDMNQQKTAQSMARAVSRQIAELKAREHSRRDAALSASAKTKVSKNLTPRSRKELVDQVFRPIDKSPLEQEQAAPKEIEDPFASLHVDFAAEQRTELKAVNFLKGGRGRAVVAQEPTEAVEQDLRAREQAVLADAGRDRPSTDDYVFDVQKDLNGGVRAMEKDAAQMATQESTEAQREALANVAEGKKANAAKKRLTAIATSHGQAGSVATSLPAKEAQEGLEQAEEQVHEAEERKGMDKTFQALGKIWAKKTNDAKLNSELATEVRVNQKIEQVRLAKAMEIQDDQEAAQLEDIDTEWEHQFPGTALPKVAKKVQSTSGWSAFSNELAEKGIHKF